MSKVICRRTATPHAALYDLIASVFAVYYDLSYQASARLLIQYSLLPWPTNHIISVIREPRPQVHCKSQPNAKTPRKTQKSTNVKSLTKIVWFQQFSELDRIGHGADVVGQSVPGGRTRMWERPLAESARKWNLCQLTRVPSAQTTLHAEKGRIRPIESSHTIFTDLGVFLMISLKFRSE